MNKEKIKKTRRAQRIRGKLQGVKNRPRLSVFRSNVAFYAQLIDDVKATTLVSATTKEIEGKEDLNKTKAAEKVGEIIAKKAKGKKVKKVAFDKGPYKYHGRVKAFAEAVRKGGLDF